MMGIVEAKRNLADLVKRASKGESTGITRRGKLVALLLPPGSNVRLAQIFADIEEIRKQVKPMKGITIKRLIEEGRR
jgi:antitoxin (DNA-binding transcriptional repressor) of toxin-antitoxin stability system